MTLDPIVDENALGEGEEELVISQTIEYVEC